MTIFWENVKGENVTTRYDVYTIANNYVKQTKKTRKIASPQITAKSQPMFSDHEASQTEWCEPFDFPKKNFRRRFPMSPRVLKSLKINENQFLNFSIKTRPCITESGQF